MAAALSAALFALPSLAATITFEAVVSAVPTDAEIEELEEVLGEPIPVPLPVLGDAGKVTVEIDDALLDAPLPYEDEFPYGSITARLEIPGLLVSEIDVNSYFGVSVFGNELHVVDDDATRLPGFPYSWDGINGVYFTFADGVGTPETFGELFAALATPGTRGDFQPSIGGYSTPADFVVDILPNAPAPIPLPASGLLLMAGLGGLAAARRLRTG
ncbi:MAG: VPLPA-CTERM sorting domain-containing protein [Pseudomonadota bacterium]